MMHSEGFSDLLNADQIRVQSRSYQRSSLLSRSCLVQSGPDFARRTGSTKRR